MQLSRRHFIQHAGAVVLGFTGLRTLLSDGGRPGWPKGGVPNGFGALVPDAKGMLDLPDGFSYQVISRAGDVMSDGFRVPAVPDGMAAFPGPRGRTILIRNHEVSSAAPAALGPFGEENGLAGQLRQQAFYDAGSGAGPCLGGTTTLVYNTRRQRLERQYLSLTGTLRNCAGGPTPWNSWITCEETVERAGDYCARDHGYVFEVPASVKPRLADPVPLKAMGRFNHEAVAVDPASGVVYETEDRHDGLIYRFVPDRPGRLAEGGRLQALALIDRPALDTRNWEGNRTVTPGTVLPVRWIDLEDVASPDDDLRYQGFDKGAARFARGEGMWYGRGAVYFACTNGGPNKKGQIWRYVPSPHEGTAREQQDPGRLELFVEPDDGGLVDNADNLTVAPWGDLILAEDGSEEQYLVGITPEGRIYKFAHNAVSSSELAGVTFSPDGSTLFVNIQKDGLTLAITGNWRSS